MEADEQRRRGVTPCREVLAQRSARAFRQKDDAFAVSLAADSDVFALHLNAVERERLGDVPVSGQPCFAGGETQEAPD